MNITLDRWQAQYILEALRVCEAQWLETSRASNDDDIQADYGNSLLRLQMVQEYVEREAVDAFGQDVNKFSHHGIPVTQPTSGSPDLQPRKLA